MCGIFLALYHTGTSDPVDALHRAVEPVHHRGPDNKGYFRDERCFLGHTRLSIIGVEASANQPFEFKHLVMTYNGEIFNYIELRDELKCLGHSFATNSDTEVVIKAYDQWGAECFARFNGMWALAIYDRQTGKVIASRDRFGQKPLFVLHTGRATYFGSEFQQLAPFSTGEIDYEIVQRFLKESHADPEGRTFMRGIEEFPKAHHCEVSLDGICASKRYWNYWDGEIGAVREQTHAEFEELLKDAVRLRLRADVPFGLLVSGGVDSTMISAYAVECAGTEGPLPAFCYSSHDRDDERSYAVGVARKLNLSLTVSRQDDQSAAYIERLRRLVERMGRGNSSLAIISVDYLYECVHVAGIKIALDGQGADELLAGYVDFFPLIYSRLLRRGRIGEMAKFLRNQRQYGIAKTSLLYFSNIAPTWVRKLMRMVYGYESLFRRVPSLQPSRFVPEQGHPARNRNGINRYLIKQHARDLEDLLFYSDIAAMNNSVENRSPFMDHRLVDFVFSHGDELKLHDGMEKYALRKLPVYAQFHAELDRRKIGFSSWMKPQTIQHMIDELASSPILDWPIFSPKLLKALRTGTFKDRKYERMLFRIFQVHLWNEIFMRPLHKGDQPARRIMPGGYPLK